jgi:CBS-domain-containing membrane protein
MSRWNVSDVMTVGAVCIAQDTPFKGIVDLMEAHGINAVPVTDSADKVLGIVTTADLLPKIEYPGADDCPRIFAVTVVAGTSLVTAAKIMDGQDLKRLPVVDDVGRLIGIVTRQDLLKVFLRSDEEIWREILDRLVGGIVGVEPSQLRVEVDDGVVTLLGELERRSLVSVVVHQVERIDGVVDVVSHLSFERDDVVDARAAFRISPF